MKKRNYLFTSESVTEGHPDKIADQISDAILDTIIAEDKNSRVACETMLTTGLAFVSGEITTSAYADIPAIIRETIKDIIKKKSPKKRIKPIVDCSLISLPRLSTKSKPISLKFS